VYSTYYLLRHENGQEIRTKSKLRVFLLKLRGFRLTGTHNA